MTDTFVTKTIQGRNGEEHVNVNVVRQYATEQPEVLSDNEEKYSATLAWGRNSIVYAVIRIKDCFRSLFQILSFSFV